MEKIKVPKHYWIFYFSGVSFPFLNHHCYWCMLWICLKGGNSNLNVLVHVVLKATLKGTNFAFRDGKFCHWEYPFNKVMEQILMWQSHLPCSNRNQTMHLRLMDSLSLREQPHHFSFCLPSQLGSALKRKNSLLW